MSMRLPQYLFDKIVEHHRRWLLEPATGTRADFTGLTLQGMKAAHYNLPGAIFNGVKLFSCDFTGANLSDILADGLCCYDVDFTGATFKNAHLSRTAYTETIFSNTDLWNVYGDGVYIISLQIGGKNVVYTSETLQINCLPFNLKDLWWMSDDDISVYLEEYHADEMTEMMAWWAKWRSQIYHIVTTYPAKPINIPK